MKKIEKKIEKAIYWHLHPEMAILRMELSQIVKNLNPNLQEVARVYKGSSFAPPNMHVSPSNPVYRAMLSHVSKAALDMA